MKPTLESILKSVNDVYSVDIREKCRRRDIAEARQMFCYLAQSEGYSWKEVYPLIGLADSTTRQYKTYFTQFMYLSDVRERLQLVCEKSGCKCNQN